MKKMLLFFILFSVALSFSPVAFAQLTGATQDQTPPQPGTGYDYLAGQIYTIDPQTGSLSLKISPPIPRARGINLQFGVEYDSNGAHHPVAGATGPTFWDNSGYLTTGGWSYNVPRLTIYQKTQITDGSGEQVVCVFYTNYIFQDMQGGTHNLGGPTNCPWGPTATTPYVSGTSPVAGAVTAVIQEVDGTVNHSPQPVTVSDSNGNVYYFSGNCHGEWNNTMGCMASWVEDRNGNRITFNDTQTAGVFSITDSIGRTAVNVSGADVSVANLPKPFVLTWSNNIGYNWPFAQQITGGEGCNPGPSPLVGTATGITQIELPNGLYYKFAYDPVTGLLNQITYPNGNTVTFTWSNAPLADSVAYTGSYQGITYNCAALMDTPAITKEVITVNGTQVLERDYSYSTPTWQLQGEDYAWTAKKTTVTTTDKLRGNSAQSVYSYAAPGPGTGNNFSQQSTVQDYDFSGKLLKTQTKTWEFIFNQPSITTTTLDNGQTSAVINCFQGYNWLPGSLQPCPANTASSPSQSNELITDVFVYDFGAGAPGTLLSHKQSVYPTAPITTPIGGFVLDRPQKTVLYDGSGNRAAETDFTYDWYMPLGISAVTATAQDDANFTTKVASRGNLTTATKVCFVPTTGASCTGFVSNYAYDQAGQVVTTYGASTTQNVVQYSHADSYNSVAQPTGNTDAFVTAITRQTTSNGVAHVSSFTYDYLSGYLTSAEDENRKNTKIYKYNDPGNLDRLTETDNPDQGTTTIFYNDGGINPNAVTTTTINSSQSSVSTLVQDGLGRKTQTQLNADPSGPDYADTTYDGMGLVWKQSNPHRSGSSATDGTVVNTYDGLGRLTQKQDQDGSSTTTAYSGAQTTVTDEAGNHRTSITDALGRLTEVIESLNGTTSYVTLYKYDVQGNLLCVEQHGNAASGTGCGNYPTIALGDPYRTRMFTYNSLGELLTAYNPETGSLAYTYDAYGNVLTKTDAKGIVTTNTYDQLNRLLTSTHSDGTPTESFVYDVSTYSGHAISNAVGHVVAAISANGASYITSYDSMGHIANTWQCTPGVTTCQTSAATYNYAGGIQTLTYPNGLVLTYGYDNAARMLQVVDNNGITYAKGALYWPNGATQQFSAPNFNYNWSFNNRLQPTQITVGSTTTTLFNKQYGYPAENNGNIISITNMKDNTRSQSFAYDGLNRLISANDNGHWADTYTYDAWGNLTAMTPGAPTGQPFSSSANTYNRLNTMQYDLDGNVTNDGAHAYTFDAEGRIAGVDSNVTFVYDAEGRRVSKSTGTNYWYGPNGSTLAETDSSGNWTNYIFFAGQRLVRGTSSGINYHIVDHLHSTSMFVTQAGAILDDQDYNPFGVAAAGVGISTSNNHYKFTAKERDIESGLDNFGARFYGSNMGRFLTPDWALKPVSVPYARFGDPQTLNLYAYVENGPVNQVDINGHCGASSTAEDTLCRANQTGKDMGNGVDGPKNDLRRAGVNVGGRQVKQLGTDHIIDNQADSTASIQRDYIVGNPDSDGNLTNDAITITITTTFTTTGNDNRQPGLYLGTKMATNGSGQGAGQTSNLSYGQAASIFGGANLSNLASSAATPDPIDNFARQVVYDINEHPGVYISHMAAVWEPRGGIVGELGFIWEMVTHPTAFSDNPPPMH